MDKSQSSNERASLNKERDLPLGNFQTQPIGALLREADLVSDYQLNLALEDQASFPNLRLGEILVMRGWIKSETADFFVKDWSKIIQTEVRQPLGYYLVKSALLEPEQISQILEQQKTTGIRFGTIAVMQGFLKSTTLDFFLASLYPKEMTTSPFVDMHGTMPLDTSGEEYIDIPLFETWDDELVLELEE